MAIGDISFEELKIGDMNLLADDTPIYIGVTIIEDILKPFGPSCEIKLLDAVDGAKENEVTGSFQDVVKVKFKDTENNKISAFEFRQHSGVGQTIAADSKRSKNYSIRCVSPEYLSKDDRTVTSAHSDKPTTEILKKTYEDYTKTKKKINVLSEAEKRDKTYASIPTSGVTRALMRDMTFPDAPHSPAAVFQTQKDGKQELQITNWEEIMKRSPKVTLKYSNVNYTGATDDEKRNVIMAANVDRLFDSSNRIKEAAAAESFNLSTHTVVDRKPSSSEVGTVKGKKLYSDKRDSKSKYSVPSSEDTINNSKSHNSTISKEQRTRYLSHLTQNQGTIKTYGNPDISLGDTITLEMPAGVDEDKTGGERQFNGDVVVVGIKHKIGTPGSSPNYIMELTVVKGGFEESKGKSA